MGYSYLVTDGTTVYKLADGTYMDRIEKGRKKMAISKIQNISKEELTRIEKVIGESFVTNELFHNWGTIEERRSAVLAYMKIYVDICRLCLSGR